MGQCNHHHHHGDLKGTKLAISILLNILITCAQIIGGFISGSLSLLSDALHNFSDVVALVISYVATSLTKKKYTPQKTFGYKRADIIAALINASTLIAIAIILVKEAVTRFAAPMPVESLWVICLAIMSIGVNAGSAFLLKKEAKHNMNIRSAYLHLLSDMVTSIAVLLGGIAMYYFQIFWVDSVLSIIIAIYLVYSSLDLVSETLGIIMQFAPKNINILDVEKKVTSIDEIANIHHVHVWQLDDTDIHLEAHVDFKKDIPLSQVSRVVRKIESILRTEFGINHVTLQPEYGCEDNKDLVVDER